MSKKIIADFTAKQITLLGPVSIKELNELTGKHGLEDFVINGWYNWEKTTVTINPTVSPIILADDPLAPPYKITCTGDPVAIIPGSTCVSHVDQTIGRTYTDPIKLSKRTISEQKCHIEPMTPEDAFQ